MSCFVALILVLAAGAAEAQEQRIPGGTFVFAGGDAQRQAFVGAIDKVVDQMNALIRGIARQKLHSRLKIEPRIAFEPRGDQVLVEHEPLPPRAVSLSGADMRLTNRSGDRVDVTYRWSGQVLTENIRSGRSSQTNAYRFSPDGARLTFTAVIRSPLLPATIRYSLVYRRNGGQDALAQR